jgi:hypothetical protein
MTTIATALMMCHVRYCAIAERTSTSPIRRPYDSSFSFHRRHITSFGDDFHWRSEIPSDFVRVALHRDVAMHGILAHGLSTAQPTSTLRLRFAFFLHRNFETRFASLTLLSTTVSAFRCHNHVLGFRRHYSRSYDFQHYYRITLSPFPFLHIII